jgi:hypothetical protein
MQRHLSCFAACPSHPRHMCTQLPHLFNFSLASLLSVAMAMKSMSSGIRLAYLAAIVESCLACERDKGQEEAWGCEKGWGYKKKWG